MSKCWLEIGLKIESKTTSVIGTRSRLRGGIKGSTIQITYTSWSGEVTRAPEVPWQCVVLRVFSTTSLAIDFSSSSFKFVIKVEINPAMLSVFNEASLKAKSQNKSWQFFLKNSSKSKIIKSAKNIRRDLVSGVKW